MVLAIIKGYRRGLIVALFSFIALVIGLAAAMKLSAVVAEHLGQAVKVSQKWLPILSFALVFLVVVLLVRLGANALQKIAETMMLGFVNRIGGILLYAALYITIYSILLFYLSQMQVFKAETLRSSVTYPFIRPWGPTAINAFGSIIPVFKDMFAQLEKFFSGVSSKV
jgi:membrane protein required for colicin V production